MLDNLEQENLNLKEQNALLAMQIDDLTTLTDELRASNEVAMAVGLASKNKNELLAMQVDDLTTLTDELRASNEVMMEAELASKNEIEHLRKHIVLLKQHIYGKKSEKSCYVDPAQQEFLFNEAEHIVDETQKEEETSATKVVSSTTARRGRKPLPDTLPRERVHHKLDSSKLLCECGGTLEEIGVDKSEVLHYRPAKYIVKEHLRYKYACKCCEEKIIRADAAFRPIERANVSSGLLANILVSKYCDHLPLYRQSAMLARQDINIPRSSLCNWIIRSSEKLLPLITLLKEELVKLDYVCSDETILNVLDNDKSTNYMWVHISGSRHNRIVIYDYQASRSKDSVNIFLKDFKGYHQSDGYSGYDELHSRASITGAGCWAHARRKFVEITRLVKNRGVAHELLELINKLYSVEKRTVDFESDEIYRYRQSRSVPILLRLHEKLVYYEKVAYPGGALHQAIKYCLNQWSKLEVYAHTGNIRIDNNDTERIIKPFVIGRKNWLFSNTEQGARSSSIIYSISETCKANKVNAYDYFKFILENIHQAKTKSELRQMLPYMVDPELLRANRSA